MQIQVNSDNTVHGDERVAQFVEQEMRAALARYGDRITRLEVHLGDVNGAKRGENDKRCLIEARLSGRKPETVSDHAGSFDAAIRGAAAKLARLLETAVGKEHAAKGADTIRKDGAYS